MNTNTNITEKELQRLQNAKSAGQWNAICRDIKDARDGSYPPDWRQKVVATGLMGTVSDSWEK